VIDQTQNTGKWNLLGRFQFNAGQIGGVAIQAQNATGTVMADAVKFVYKGGSAVSDNTAPSVTKLNVTKSTEIVVEFNEAVERTSAMDVNNYTFAPAPSGNAHPAVVEILFANLVRLTISALTVGTVYDVSVANVSDLAGNIMGPSVFKIDFKGILDITSLSPAGRTAFAVAGRGVYIHTDRDYSVSVLPDTFKTNTLLIQTANDDKGNCDPVYLSFDISMASKVYVAWPANLTPASWLNNWTSTGWQVTTVHSSGVLLSFNLYEQNFMSGTVQIPGACVPQNTGYFVLVKPVSGSISVKEMNRPSDGLGQINLQLAPNPFNPITQISFYLPQEERISLKVFDVSGRERGVMIDRKIIKNFHSFGWDAGSLSAGIYLIKLITAEKTMTTKALLIK